MTADVGNELERRPWGSWLGEAETEGVGAPSGELSPEATEGVTDCHF